MARPFFKGKAAEQKPTKKEKDKKDRSYQKSKIRLLIWAVLIVFVLASIQSIFLSRNAIRQLQTTREQVTVLEKELDKLDKQQKIDIPTTNAFLTDFLTTYYSVSKDREQELTRREKLAKYYTGLVVQAASTPTTDLTVQTIENYGYQQKKQSYVGTFFVETKTTQEEPKVFQSIVNVEFKITKKGYQICALPYQQSDTRKHYVDENKETRHEKRSDPLQDTYAKEKVQAFTEQFLKEYEQNNRDNLRYLMKDVEGLPSNVKVETKDFSVYKTENHPIVDVTLVLTYKDTGITFQQGVELHLSKTDDGKYFIDDIIHY